MFSLKTIIAFAALTTFVVAQDPTDVLAVRALANTATCPADQGPDVNANVLAVVRFVETATATASLGGINLAQADLSVNLDVCLCVDANVAVGAIDLPVDLNADAIADIQAFAAVAAAVDPLAAVFNNVLGLAAPGVTDVDVTADLVPVRRDTCICPAEATPTCANGTCSCDCPTGFFYEPTSGQCLLRASAALNGRRSKMPSFIRERQAKRSALYSSHRA